MKAPLFKNGLTIATPGITTIPEPIDFQTVNN